MTGLIAYDLGQPNPMPLVTAPVQRGWMDATRERFAYRCLPMLIANQSGWFVLGVHKISAVWDGGDSTEALSIEYVDGILPRYASSHFGHGILTFTMTHIFRTSPGWNLQVRGPANSPKDGVSPLEGIVETDWAESSFTMNWQLTRPHHRVTFEIGEPIAQLVPMRRGELEGIHPEVRSISDDPEMKAGYEAFAASRSSFNENRAAGKWQRHYLRGETVTSEKAPQHQTALNLREFAR